MKVFDAIMTRRSIRAWKPKDVPDDLITRLIDAAIHAPSSHNSQPWHFIIIRDKSVKQKIAESRPEGNRWEADAPVLISVCVDLDHSPVRWMEDGSAATQNILLAAHDLGLGAVWFSGARGYEVQASETEIAIRTDLELPPNVRPVSNIAVGYPNETPRPKKLVDIQSTIHHEKFDLSKRRKKKEDPPHHK